MRAVVAGAILWALASTAGAATTAAANVAANVPATVPATVDEPRAFGHVIGDVLTQRVLLESSGRDLGDVAMPSAGRVGVWFERRNPRIERDEEGRRWMAFDYQVTTAPQMLTTVNLPALSLATPSGAVLQVPEWPISVAPLTPKTAFGTGALQPLLSDRQAPPIATGPLKERLGWSLGVLALSLIAWFGWWRWRNRREAARLPFARAWHQMRRLDAQDVDRDERAWTCLHRALNETAGHVMQGGSLSMLLSRAPHLQPLQPRLETFYRQSDERFFASRPAGDARFALLELSRELYRAERRQHR
jgi:mxaA protein